MNILNIRKAFMKIDDSFRHDRLAKRIVAASLAMSTLFSTAAGALAAGPTLNHMSPTMVPDGDPNGEFPVIEIQGNFVRSEFGALTDYFELSLRLKSGSGKFFSLATTLQYDTQYLTPVSWTWAPDGDAPVTDLPLDAERFYGVDINTQKDEVDTGAIAQCGIVPADKAGDVSADIKDGRQALLFFKAEAYRSEGLDIGSLTGETPIPSATPSPETTDTPAPEVTEGPQPEIRIQEDNGGETTDPEPTEPAVPVTPPSGTTSGKTLSVDTPRIATIRFYVNPELKEKLKIKRSGSTENFIVYYDGKVITNVDELAVLMGEPSRPLVSFAANRDVTLSKSPAGLALRYTAGNNEFYYVPEYAADPTFVSDQEIPLDPDWENTVTIPRPGTAADPVEDAILAVSPDGTTYSYLSNLIPKENITFPLVSVMSVTDKGIDTDKFVTLVYLDWDDSIIGTQIVPKREDVRAKVNTFVEENFVHPDLRASAHAGDVNYTDSLDRIYTYRGTYPAEGPGGSTVDEQGASYPLTNKLDYSFLRRQAVGETTDVDGIETTTWTTQKISEIPDEEDALPYIYGWALVGEGMEGSENVWTTFGSGELGGVDFQADTTFKTKGESAYLRFADFKYLNPKGGTLFVKACYEPGTELKTLAVGSQSFYSILSGPNYVRYGADDTNLGGVYAITFQYARINEAGYGVQRTRDPVVRLTYTPDLEGLAGTAFSLGIVVTNTDIMDVEFTPSSAILEMTYNLSEKMSYNENLEGIQEDNFYAAPVRSTVGNEMNVSKNFDYDNFTYADRLGTSGFVTRATLNQFLEFASKAIASDDRSNYDSVMTRNTFIDLNLKMDKDGSEISAIGALRVQTLLLDAVEEAIKQGHYVEIISEDGTKREKIADLDWHQIQYYLLNVEYTSAGPNVTITKSGFSAGVPDSTHWGAYSWCRIDDCAGGAEPITSLEKLMEAAWQFNGQPNPNALNLLNDNFYLRRGITAKEFDPASNLQEFKDAIVKVADDLRAGGVSMDDAKAMSWEQIQYLLDKGGSSIPAQATAEAEDYWWKNNGKKTFTDWAELLEIQYRIDNSDYDPSWLGGLTLQNVQDGLNITVESEEKQISMRTKGDGTKFEDLDAFKRALSTAVSKLVSDGGYTEATLQNVSALELQHVLISGNPYKTETELRDMTTAGTINYWWITGAPTPENWQGLLDLGWQIFVDQTAPEDMLVNVTVELVSRENFWLRGDDNGTNFASDETLHGAIKTAIQALNGKVNKEDVTWEQFQHALLGKGFDPDPDPDGSKYWWKDGGHKPIRSFADLLEAAWNSYGTTDGTPPSDTMDANAMDALTDADLEFINGIERTDRPEDYLDFRKDTEGTEYTSVDDFKAALKEAIIKVVNRSASKDYVTGRTWIEIQHLLLGNGFRSEANLRKDTEEGKINYWWENGGSKPAPSTVDYTWANDVVSMLTEYVSSLWANGAEDVTPGDVASQISDETLAALNFQDGSGNLLTKEELAGYLIDAEGAAWGEGSWNGNYTNDDTGFVSLPWKPLQQWIIAGGIDTDDQKLEHQINDFSWTPTSVDYTSANECTAGLTEYVSNLWAEGAEDVTTDDIVPQISDEMLTALNFRDGSGTPLTKEELADYIIAAEGASWEGVWHGVYSDDDTGIARIPWKSLQYWIMTGGADSGEQKLEAGVRLYWFPANDVPAVTYSIRKAPNRLIHMYEPEETIETVLSEDGLTEITTHTLHSYNTETARWETVVTVTTVTITGNVKVTTIVKTKTIQDPDTGKWTTTTDTSTKVEEIEELPEPTESVAPSESVEPSETPEPGESPTPSETPEPAESPEPSETPDPTESVEPTETPVPTESPEPTGSPEPTETPEPTVSPEPAESPQLSEGGNSGSADNGTEPEGTQSPPAEKEAAQESGGSSLGLPKEEETMDGFTAGILAVTSLLSRDTLVGDSGGRLPAEGGPPLRMTTNTFDPGGGGTFKLPTLWERMWTGLTTTAANRTRPELGWVVSPPLGRSPGNIRMGTTSTLTNRRTTA